MPVLRRKTLLTVLIAICSLGGLFALRTHILTGIGDFLIVHDKLDPSDIIFVLNGDVASRPFQAARLMKEGIANKVVIARAENSLAVEMGLTSNITDQSVAVMKKAGIAGDKITLLEVPKGVTSTFDEAIALRHYAQQNSFQRVTVVTSAIHTRRARWIITKALNGANVKIMMSPAADPRYTSSNWWTQEDGLIGYQNEYIKLVYYLFKYR